MEPPEVTGRRAPLDPVEHVEAGPEGRAGSARGAQELAGTPAGFGEPVGSLVTRAPLMLDPATTVADVARAMRGARRARILHPAQSRRQGVQIQWRRLKSRYSARDTAAMRPSAKG